MPHKIDFTAQSRALLSVVSIRPIMARKYKQRSAHQKHTRSFKKDIIPKIYFTKQDKPYEKIRQSKRSGRAKDQAAQKIGQSKRSGRAED